MAICQLLLRQAQQHPAAQHIEAQARPILSVRHAHRVAAVRGSDWALPQLCRNLLGDQWKDAVLLQRAVPLARLCTLVHHPDDRLNQLLREIGGRRAQRPQLETLCRKLCDNRRSFLAQILGSLSRHPASVDELDELRRPVAGDAHVPEEPPHLTVRTAGEVVHRVQPSRLQNLREMAFDERHPVLGGLQAEPSPELGGHLGNLVELRGARDQHGGSQRRTGLQQRGIVRARRDLAAQESAVEAGKPFELIPGDIQLHKKLDVLELRRKFRLGAGGPGEESVIQVCNRAGSHVRQS